MATFSATCSTHGDIKQDGKYFAVIHEVDRDEYYYRFLCPGSEETDQNPQVLPHIELKTLSEGILDLLVENGVPVVELDLLKEHQAEGPSPVETVGRPIHFSEVDNYIIDLALDDPLRILEMERSALLIDEGLPDGEIMARRLKPAEIRAFGRYLDILGEYGIIAAIDRERPAKSDS